MTQVDHRTTILLLFCIAGGFQQSFRDIVQPCFVHGSGVLCSVCTQQGAHLGTWDLLAGRFCNLLWIPFDLQRPPIARCLAVEAHHTSLFHPISLLRREVGDYICTLSHRQAPSPLQSKHGLGMRLPYWLRVITASNQQLHLLYRG